MAIKWLVDTATISIHALREERDITADALEQFLTAFQSTRSARSATYTFPFNSILSIISIHALREERDIDSAMT